MARKRKTRSKPKVSKAEETKSKTDFAALVSDQSGLFPQGADQDSIQSAEDSIGLSIPKSLQSFLRWRDGGTFAAKRFIVFSAGEGIHPDETLIAANSDRGSDFPILSIARDATYDFGFQKSDLSKADPPVYSFAWELEKPEQVADSFSDWIKWAVQIAMQ